jgi:hypothetical protein
VDSTKLKVLQALPYRILPVCGLCKHGWFPKNDWGTCERNTYPHEKHSGPPRQLSIHKFGSCWKFSRKDNLSYLSGFREFGP